MRRSRETVLAIDRSSLPAISAARGRAVADGTTSTTGQLGSEAVRDHSAAGAFEKRGAKPTLQIGKLVAERGLGEVQLLPGAGERAELGNGDDESKVADLEAH